MFKKIAIAAALTISSMTANAGVFTDTIEIAWQWDVNRVTFLAGPGEPPAAPQHIPTASGSFEVKPGTFEVEHVNYLLIDNQYMQTYLPRFGGTNQVVKWGFYDYIIWTTRSMDGNIFWGENDGNSWVTGGVKNAAYTVSAATNPEGYVPLPGTIALLGLGMAGLGIRSLRKE